MRKKVFSSLNRLVTRITDTVILVIIGSYQFVHDNVVILVFVSGLVLLSVGLFMIYKPLGFVGSGIILIYSTMFGSKSQSVKEDKEL